MGAKGGDKMKLATYRCAGTNRDGVVADEIGDQPACPATRMAEVTSIAQSTLVFLAADESARPGAQSTVERARWSVIQHD